MDINQLKEYCNTQALITQDDEKVRAYLKVASFLKEESPNTQKVLTELAETAAKARETVEVVHHAGYAAALIDTYQAQAEVCEELYGFLTQASRSVPEYKD